MQERFPHHKANLDAQTSAVKRELIAKLLQGDFQPSASVAASIPPRPGHTAPQLSLAQERLWFLDQLMPGSPVFNVPMAVRISRPLNLEILQLSLDEIVRRHEVFRTGFMARDGVPTLVIAPHQQVIIEVTDLTSTSEAKREAEARACVQRHALRSFDISTSPLVRVGLIRNSPTESILLLTMHHIVSDGNSILLFFRELSTLYDAFATNQTSPLKDLPIQYADYAAWQRTLQDDFTAEQLSYWKETLSGDLPILDLPTDYARPPIQTHPGARVVRTLSKELTRSLTTLSQREGATLFMTLLAGFKILLHRLSGQADIIVGSPISNRPRSETENLIGFFLNNLALRTELSGDPTFREVLSRVRRTALDAYANQDVPFEKLLEELKPDRDLSRTSIFQVYFNLFSFSDRIELPGGDSISFVDGWLESEETLAKFDLTLYAGAGEQDIKLALVYNTDLFARARIDEMSAQLEQLMRQAVREPDLKISEFSLVTSTAPRVLPNPTEPFSQREFKSIPQWFAQQAQRRPQALAVCDSQESWTYAALDERTDQLAKDLFADGIRKGDIVAIYGHRNSQLVIAILGVLKAGAVFTILDPQYPTQRLIDCLRIAPPRGWIQLDAAGVPPSELKDFIDHELDCDCQLRLKPRSSLNPAHSNSPSQTDIPRVKISADDLAYIAFTSGSTGQPKGVMGRHGPLTQFTSWATTKFDLNESDRFCMLSGLAHDPLHRDIFTPLQLGAAVCIPEPAVLESSDQLRSWMIDQKVTVANLTPAMSQLLTDGIADEQIKSLRYSFLVGDVLTNRDVARMQALAPSITCVNLYGSTETQRAVGHYVSLAKARSQSNVKEILPLGKGILDVQLLILNQRQKLCGIGEAGEIYFRSPHLAKGYLGDDVLTRERFIANPFTKDPSDRLYRTGDLGRYLPDGNVEHAGRADRQVKIRGFRVEPAEIEAVLKQHPHVREATVISYSAKTPDKANRNAMLVAYVVPKDEQRLNPVDLREHLAAKVPHFMIPSAFVSLKSLPLTPNGKLDRAALPPPHEMHAPRPDVYVAPTSPNEEALVALWQEVMGHEQIGVNDNFFEFGGHSLLAVRLFALIEKQFGKRLPLATLFRSPTIAQLANALEHDAHWTSLVPIQSAGSRPPFFCVHAVGGNVLEYYDLARHLGAAQPFYGLQSHGLNGEAPHTDIREMAAYYLKEIRELQPRGPYFLGGRSLGGIIAFEMACQLRDAGAEVAMVALLDSYPVGYEKSLSRARTTSKASRFMRRARAHLTNIDSLPFSEKLSYLSNKSKYGSVRIKSRAWRTIYRGFKGLGRDLPKSLRDVEEFNWLAARQFVPRSYDGRVTLFWASQDLRAKFDMIEGWKTLARAVDVIEVPGTHLDIIKEPHVAELAEKLRGALDLSQERH